MMGALPSLPAQSSFQHILHALPVAVVLSSLDGLILEVNEACAALLQSTRDAVIGRSLIEIGLFPEQHVLGQIIDDLFACGGTRSIEFDLRTTDGAVYRVQNDSRCVEINGKLYLLTVVHDITARHKAETLLKQSAGHYQTLLAQAERSALEMNLLNRVRNLVARQVNMPDLIRSVVEGIAEVSGYTLVSLYLVEDDVALLQHQVGYDRVIERIPVSLGVLGRVIRTGKPIFLQDTAADPEFLGAIPGITSEIGVPLYDGEQVVGALNVEATDARRLTRRDLDFLTAVAEHVSIALHHARLFNTERQQRLLAETLSLSAADLATADDLEDMLQAVFHHLRGLMPVFDAGAAYVLVLKSNPPRYVVMRVTGEASQPAELAEGETPPGLFWQRAALAGDTALYMELNSAQIAALPPDRAWIRSVVAVPLRAKERVIGFIELTSQNARQFKRAHAVWLQAIADQAGPALQNAQHAADLKRQTQLLEERIEERTRQYRQTKEQVEVILNSSGESILLLDRDGIIQQANPAFHSLIGFELDEATGINLTQLVTAEHRERVAALLQTVLQQHRPARSEVELIATANRSLIVEVTLSPIISHMQDSRRTGIVCTLHDITARRQLEAELRSALKKERQLVEMKSRFSAMISHEFRTPLATIQSSNELLQAFYDRLPAERRADLFRTISEQVQHLSGLLDDIMTLSRAETVGLDFQPRWLNLVTLCEQIINQFNLHLTDRPPIALKTSAADIVAYVDAHLMRRVLMNLIGNAIKYSGSTSRVQVEVDRDSEHVILRIIDEGIGIPPDDIAHLFNAFYRASNVGTIPGTGLGLAIVRRAVDAHGGAIEVTSQVDRGTTFTVLLPQDGEKQQGADLSRPAP